MSERKPRIRLSAEDRRELITSVCAELVATQGYAATGLRVIAAEAGVSVGTLLHHYETKDEILAATLVEVSERFHARARAAMLAERDPTRRLRAVVASVFDGPESEQGWRVWMAFWYEASLNPRLSAVAGMRNAMWESLLTTVIADACAAVDAPCEDPEMAAAELAALINGVAIQMCAEPDRWSRERAHGVVDRAVTSLVAGS